MSSESPPWTPGLARRLGVPDDVALVYEYVNSLDQRTFSYRGHRNLGGDELSTVQNLRSWLVSRGLVDGDDSVSARNLAIARALRSSLRQSIAEHVDHSVPRAASSVVVSARLPLEVTMAEHGRLLLRPRTAGMSAGLSLVLIEAVTACPTGAWQRLKMCGAADCRWIFFDSSKPRTARWCETDICGNRVKKTNQRERRRQPPTTATVAIDTSDTVGPAARASFGSQGLDGG